MQKLTILFDLDGTLVDSAPDLMNAHNFVMKKFPMSCSNFFKKISDKCFHKNYSDDKISTIFR